MPTNLQDQTIIVSGLEPEADGSVNTSSSGGSAFQGGTSALAWSAPDGLADGNTLTITTDGTFDFGTKANAKPLLVWDANDGADANLSLGRIAWSDGNANTETTDVVANGSTRSYSFDHGASSGKALGRVDFNSRDVFVFRKLYEALDITTDYAIRSRIKDVVGDASSIVQGMVVTGATSGATGVVQSINVNVSGGPFTHYIYFEQSGGSVNDSSPTDFLNGETATVNGVSFTIQEVAGTARSSNYKTLRFWSDTTSCHINKQGTQGSDYVFTPESTGSTVYPNIVHQLPNTWLSQAYLLRGSSADDAYDASITFKQNDSQFTETNFRSRSSAFTGPYNWVAQTQVSNGMQPDSKTYWDYLLVDEDFKQVIIGNAPTWAACTEFEPCPIIAYAQAEVSVVLRQGSLSSIAGSYLYKLDNDGLPLLTSGVAL